jgi:ketol-acid reductoisomerase
MYRRVSETARYGGLTRGPVVMNKETKERMKKILDQVKDGTFNEEWISEYKKNGKNAFERFMNELDAHQVEQVGKKMRQMMWPGSTE